jgi:hypothetical protein
MGFVCRVEAQCDTPGDTWWCDQCVRSEAVVRSSVGQSGVSCNLFAANQSFRTHEVAECNENICSSGILNFPGDAAFISFDSLHF